ncbi:MAG: hypothetical protein ACJAT9_000248 [Polaribacter sp.]|jgi:hypothetical protein|tara:strand:+ start:57 stop:830 length:774 start_codon:yes stop_codon:yes gene_type:complete
MNLEDLEKLKPGDNHYKAYIGPPLKYDLVGAMQFNLLTSFGIRDFHKLVDIGCGSLRSGKLMIPFLRKGNYYGVEPNNWLIEEGVKNELGNEIISLKSPTFSNTSNFDLQSFETKFDYLIAQSIFSHTSREQIIRCLSEVKIAMKEEGFFLATFVLGKENYSGSEWVYPGCVKYRHSFIMNLIREEKLDAIKTKWNHPNGQTWYVIFHPENRTKVAKINGKLFSVNRSKFSIKKFAKKHKLLNNAFTRKIYKVIKRS